MLKFVPFDNQPQEFNKKYILRCVWNKPGAYFHNTVEWCFGYYATLGDEKRKNGWAIVGYGFLHQNPDFKVTHFAEYNERTMRGQLEDNERTMRGQ